MKLLPSQTPSRGALAAFFFSLALGWAVPALASDPSGSLGPDTVSQQFRDGLTVIARQAGVAPVTALEVWIRCPANDYDGSKPGIARLTALAVIEQKIVGGSLRDDVRKAGAQVAVSVYQESTEFTILAPSYIAPSLLDKLTAAVLHPRVDQAAFDAARTRLAAGQVAASEVVDQLLRDALFTQMFAAGPLHDSTYGNPTSLRNLKLSDVTGFIDRAYVPGSEIVVAVGHQNQADTIKHVGAVAPSPASPQPMPNSTLAPASNVPLALQSNQTSSSGVALGWVGPPIADERAATAMDFLSDYLTHPGDGVLSKTVSGLDQAADFNGQFITLRNPGVFFMTAASRQVDPAVLQNILRDAMRTAVGHEFSKAEFDHARDAFVTHLLRDMQTSETLADNYGWYFAQGALPYSPSVAGVSLSGDYFGQVDSLSPDYVYSIAKKYLLVNPFAVVLPKSAPRPTGAAG